MLKPSNFFSFAFCNKSKKNHHTVSFSDIKSSLYFLSSAYVSFTKMLCKVILKTLVYFDFLKFKYDGDILNTNNKNIQLNFKDFFVRI